MDEEITDGSPGPDAGAGESGGGDTQPRGEQQPGQGAPGDLDPRADDRAAGESRAQERIRELNERAKAAERHSEFLMQKFGQPERRETRQEMPKEFEEIHGHLGGYLMHHLNPLAQMFMDARERSDRAMSDMRDEARYYRANPDMIGKADLIESAVEALSEKFGKSISRADAVAYLKGHEKYAAQFTTTEKPEDRLAGQHVDALRTAARTAGRTPAAARSAQTSTPPDLSEIGTGKIVDWVEKNHAGGVL